MTLVIVRALTTWTDTVTELWVTTACSPGDRMFTSMGTWTTETSVDGLTLPAGSVAVTARMLVVPNTSGTVTLK